MLRSRKVGRFLFTCVWMHVGVRRVFYPTGTKHSRPGWIGWKGFHSDLLQHQVKIPQRFGKAVPCIAFCRCFAGRMVTEYCSSFRFKSPLGTPRQGSGFQGMDWGVVWWVAHSSQQLSKPLSCLGRCDRPWWPFPIWSGGIQHGFVLDEFQWSIRTLAQFDKHQTPRRTGDSPHRGHERHGQTCFCNKPGSLMGSGFAFQVPYYLAFVLLHVLNEVVHLSYVRPSASAIQAKQNGSTGDTICEANFVIGQTIFKKFHFTDGQDSSLSFLRSHGICNFYGSPDFCRERMQAFQKYVHAKEVLAKVDWFHKTSHARWWFLLTAEMRDIFFYQFGTQRKRAQREILGFVPFDELQHTWPSSDESVWTLISENEFHVFKFMFSNGVSQIEPHRPCFFTGCKDQVPFLERLPGEFILYFLFTQVDVKPDDFAKSTSLDYFARKGHRSFSDSVQISDVYRLQNWSRDEIPGFALKNSAEPRALPGHLEFEYRLGWQTTIFNHAFQISFFIGAQRLHNLFFFTVSHLWSIDIFVCSWSFTCVEKIIDIVFWIRILAYVTRQRDFQVLRI